MNDRIEAAVLLQRDMIPRTRAFDSTWHLARNGYGFIAGTCAELGTDIFRTRIAFRPVICLTGPAAAEMFYGEDRFTRTGALPPTVVRLLQDYGSVQMLDGEAHRHRKAMFLNLIHDDKRVDLLAQLFEAEWDRLEADWPHRRNVSLLPEVSTMLGRAAWRWAGLPDDPGEMDALTGEMDSMVANAGRFGPRNWYAQLERVWAEGRLRDVIREIRSGQAEIARDAPASVVARHRDENGRMIEVDVAAVELLNLLRPIVAVSRFIVFCAIALEREPKWRTCFGAGDYAMLENFAEEVRRSFPFFPFVGGKVKTAFRWRGYDFEQGQWVLLDLYGTCKNPRCFPDPESFDVERDRGWRAESNCFIPQGGGHTQTGHRCPGEPATVALMMTATRRLARLYYSVPPESLHLPPRRYPPQPRNGFVIDDIKRAWPGDAL